MKMTYRLAFLLLAVAFTVIVAALVVADDADAAGHDVRLTYKDDDVVRMAKGLNPVSFNYTIKATGDVMSQEMIIQLKDEPPAWQHYLSATTNAGTSMSTGTLEILMGKGEIANLSLQVTPGLNQLNMTYWLTVNAFPKKEPTNNESHSVGVVIPQKAAFEISVFNPPPYGIYRAIPPSTVTIRFALYNSGNGMDKFLIQGESSRSQAGWKLSFVSGIDEYGFTENITADPTRRNPYFIDVKIPIPAGERADVTCQVTVNATSMYNQTKQMPPAFVQIEALQYYNFQVFINGLDEKEGTPGEQIEFQLRIQNLGNGWDEFSVQPIWDEGLNPGFIASANPRTINVDSNTSEIVQYIVKVPVNAPKKNYFFTAEILSRSPELTPVTKSFSVIVGQYFAIELSSAIPKMSTIPGGILDYEVNVHNAGNGLDSITIKLDNVPPGWLTYIQPPEVSLLQEQESIIQIRIIVPSRFEEAPIGSYNLTVKADSSRSTAQDIFEIQLDITQFYRIEWIYQDLPITDPDAPIAQQGIIKPRRSFNPHEKESIDITLEIKNYGNGDDNITMDGYSPDPRIIVTVTPLHTQLLRDQVKFVKVTVRVPDVLPPGVYNLFVNSSSQDPSFVQRVVPLDFEVFNYDALVPPIPTFIDPARGDVVRAELTVSPGQNLTFKLKIENNGTKPMSTVLLKVFDNYVKDGEPVRWNFYNITTVPIAVGDRFIIGDRGNEPLFWWSNVSGTHVLEFKAFYDHQANVGNDVAKINITVEKKAGGRSVFGEDPILFGLIIAVVIAVLIVASYVFVLKRKPQVDADLYSSIYGADYDDDIGFQAEAAVPDAESSGLTPEQQALYGDDYTGDSEDDGDYDYDYEDEEYDYEDEEKAEEVPK